MRRSVALFFVILLTACKSKSSSCAKVSQAFDPITKELDAVAASADTAPPPTPADPSSCTPLTERRRRLESAEAKLALVVTDDAGLAKHLATYREHVSEWAKATKKAQVGCLGRDGNAMTSGISEAIQHRAQLPAANADITNYCKAP